MMTTTPWLGSGGEEVVDATSRTGPWWSAPRRRAGHRPVRWVGGGDLGVDVTRPGIGRARAVRVQGDDGWLDRCLRVGLRAERAPLQEGREPVAAPPGDAGLPLPGDPRSTLLTLRPAVPFGTLCQGRCLRAIAGSVPACRASPHAELEIASGLAGARAGRGCVDECDEDRHVGAAEQALRRPVDDALDRHVRDSARISELS